LDSRPPGPRTGPIGIARWGRPGGHQAPARHQDTDAHGSVDRSKRRIGRKGAPPVEHDLECGKGTLELRPQNDPATDTTVAYQRIYSHDANGTPFLIGERQVGTFVFHEAHGHWHFEGFALYQILEVTAGGGFGAVLRESDKVSFCIINTTNVPDTLEHSGWGGNYSFCGQNVLYGLKVGWGDTYTSGLAGQYVPIAGLLDGTYWLRSIADFENRLREVNERNNGKTVKIRITENSVSLVP
jgi:hypothetical protein